MAGEDGAFMVPQMTGKVDWVELDTSHGTFFVPNDLVGLDAKDCKAINDSDEVPYCLKDFVEPGARLLRVRITKGYGVRSSAPGYLDCTDWRVFTNKKDALAAFREEKRACRGEDD